MYGEVTSRNRQAYSWGHLVLNKRQCGDNCKLNLFLERKVGVTERLRSLNPIKALAIAICPIICLFYDLASALMHDVQVNLRAQ